MLGRKSGIFGSLLMLPLLLQELATVLIGVAPEVDAAIQAVIAIAGAVGLPLVASSSSVLKGKDQ